MNAKNLNQSSLKPLIAIVGALFTFLVLALPVTLKVVETDFFGLFDSDEVIEIMSEGVIEVFHE